MLTLTVFLFQLSLIGWLYPRKDPERPRIATMKWLTKNELVRFAILLSNLFSIKTWSDNPRKNSGHKQWKDLILIAKKIENMWDKSGITFTISYWAEVTRLTIQYLDPKSLKLYNTKLWVKIHKGNKDKLGWYGLPKVLPDSIKNTLCVAKNRIYSGSLPRGLLIKIKLILSMLAFFRACSPKYSKVSWSSITDPFNGVSTSLSEMKLRKGLKSLGITTIKVGKPSIFWASSKTGPNFPVATLGLGLDLIGWIMRPWKWWAYVKICAANRYYVCLFQFVVLSILVAPIALLCFYISIRPTLGHIAVLEEARGKRRKIGITDFWTQILFRPLHDAIYLNLAKVSNDGTNNQVKPIKLMIEALNISNFHRANPTIKKDRLDAPDLAALIQKIEEGNLRGSFSIPESTFSLADRKKCIAKGGPVKRVQSLDLTAATDRLPVDVQAQILNLLGYPGDLWKEILDREWTGTGLPNNSVIKYSVGQPMGAYSSFAMLALTNHVLVHIAMNETNQKVPYGILGDDVAIAGKNVSNYYRNLLRQLGVDVNPMKGFDGGILEFAKQLWTINGINLSPLGAKNITLCLRNPAFLPSVLYELWTKMFPLTFKQRCKKSIRERKKRRVRGIESPFITVHSLLSLYSKLWTNLSYNEKLSKFTMKKDEKGREMKYSWVGAILHLAAYIGPRSGLWYIKDDVRGYLRGWDYDLYQKLWWDLLVLKNNPLVKGSTKNKIVNLLKFQRENNIFISRTLRTSWVQGIKMIRELILYPFTSLPKVRGFYWFENKQFHLAKELITLIYYYSVMFSPAVLIVTWSYIKNFMKLISGSYDLLIVRFLRWADLRNKNGIWQGNENFLPSSHIRVSTPFYLRKGYLFTIITLIALRSDILTLVLTTFVFYIINIILISRWARLWLNSRIYWSKIYGIQGRNIITDATSEYFNPLNPLSNLLGLVDRQVINGEQVPAFKEICSLLRNYKLVKAWKIERNEVIKLESENKLQKSRKLNSDSKDVSISETQNSFPKQDKLLTKNIKSTIDSGSGKTGTVKIIRYKVKSTTFKLDRENSYKKGKEKKVNNNRAKTLPTNSSDDS